MSDDPHSVGDILDTLDELADDGDRVSLGDVVEAFGSRGYGPFLIVPALMEISPIGGIPVVPTILAAIIILFAGQMAFGREHLWLPGWLMRRSVSSGRMHRAVDTLRGTGRLLDRLFHGRLPALTTGPFVRIAAAASILLALTVPPLEFIPFASTAPMAAIAAFGLAMLVRDGALMIAAMLIAVGAGVVGVVLAVK